MSWRRALTAALALAAVCLAGVAGDASAQAGAVLAVDPRSLTVGLDDGAFDVRVLIDEVTDPDGLGGYTFLMSYDPSVVRALSATDSGFISESENAAICPASAVNNEAGRAAIFCFSIPLFGAPGPQTTEPRLLATVRFEPVAVGSTALDISDTSITDPSGNVLASTTTGGEVRVESGSRGPTPPPVGNGAVPPAVGTGETRGGDSVAPLLSLLVALTGSAAIAAGIVVGWSSRRV